ncbi:acyltransferase family protein [Caenimonas terrae]|uniref:Acyltransferase family protein n=1 Tax=Caenimonas terrae TaxID=696074 RepID=A0ABW0NAB2_9BURK
MPAHAAGGYRTDIEGLRALAVLAVVVFHAFPVLLPAGFFGVDIFFVISGFVITRTIARELALGSFSIARFYGRRVRRLFPALALSLAATLGLAWFVLLPDELAAAGRLAVAGGLSVANLQLMNQSGYFDAATSRNPLMHLWSLGVEEQFYLCWPLLFMLLGGWQYRRAVVLVIAVVSFALAGWWAVHDPVLAFYSPLSRGWELLVGAYLAMPRSSGPSRPVLMSASLRSTVGLALMLVGLCIGTGTSSAVRLDMVLPVVGAALAVSGGEGPAAALLSAAPMRWLGSISYPLYLWHWPLLAFRNLVGDPADPAIAYTLVSIVVAVGLADLTYRFVERPVRRAFPARKATMLCVAALALSVALGALLQVDEGVPGRQVVVANGKAATAKLGRGKELAVDGCLVNGGTGAFQFCSQDADGPSDAAVWGDSKAHALYWGLLRESHWTWRSRWLLLANPGCVPSDLPSGIGACDHGNQLALKALLGDQVRTVVLVFAARSMGVQIEGSERGVEHVAAALLKAGKRVVIVIDNPTVTEQFDRPSTCARMLSVPLLKDVAAGKRCNLSYAKHLASTRDYRAALDRIAAAHPALLLLDMAPFLCDIPHDICPVARDGKYLYSYGDHISDTANEMAARLLLPALYPSETPAGASPSVK